MEFAKSLSGHDKNQYYFVLQKDGEFCMLVNGTNRPVEKPKKKNQKHIQVIKNLPQEVLEILEQKQNNLTIKRAIKCYERFVNQ